MSNFFYGNNVLYNTDLLSEILWSNNYITINKVQHSCLVKLRIVLTNAKIGGLHLACCIILIPWRHWNASTRLEARLAVKLYFY